MAALQSPGLATGLDVNSIVSQLMALEQRPLLRLAEREAEFQAEISVLGSLKSALAQLQSAVGALQETSTFEALKASSSNTDILSATADDTASAGSFSVVVDRLAQRHKLASAELNSTDTFGGSPGDGLTFTVGATGFSVDLSTAKTLEEIRDAVSAEANTTGATALIVNGDSGKQTLVLTAEETGFAERIQLSYAGNIKEQDFGFATINKDGNGALITDDTELDAFLTVEGVSVTRGGNNIGDVVEGVTLELEDVGAATVDVARDTAPISDGVQALVAAYNKLRSDMSGLSASDFGGDSLLRTIESQIRTALNTQFLVGGSFAYVQEIGISTAESGDLQLDNDALSSAIESDLQGLAALFSDTDNGFAVNLDAMLERFVETDGLIDSRVDGLNSQISGLESQRGGIERRLVSTEERLRAQFAALDQLVSQLQSTSNFLTQQLANLPGAWESNT